jgi:hypothetical protein
MGDLESLMGFIVIASGVQPGEGLGTNVEECQRIGPAQGVREEEGI